jgi:DNA-binding SARP family transcriptional activator
MSKSQWTNYDQMDTQSRSRMTRPSAVNEAKSPALEALRSLKESREQKFKELELEQQIVAMEQELERQRIMEEGLSVTDKDDELPSRKELFPSNSSQITKWFYNLIFLIFLAVLISLLLWGRHMVA